MDLRFSEEYEAFRRELRGFLKASWPLRSDEDHRLISASDQPVSEKSTTNSLKNGPSNAGLLTPSISPSLAAA